MICLGPRFMFWKSCHHPNFSRKEPGISGPCRASGQKLKFSCLQQICSKRLARGPCLLFVSTNDVFTGHDMSQFTHNFSSSYNPPKYHNCVSCNVFAPRCVIQGFSHECFNSKEGSGMPLPTCIGLSRSSKASMAQIKGASDG